ncbi:hypothetical protein KFZ70_13775 [Tamlana fucoidanivorans]|uniref:Uncharacterized protein n=1 Tax=Allotamlana fucoidanivorans TaxID=2583814 RepID=A0A5C4SQC5_9FLAO|nr:hypothetical protein [Tamlana fucoidanivorans]TNJ46496.1 hypothetical protein FGF67_02390 [Tamlana fucoidanivorans]
MNTLNIYHEHFFNVLETRKKLLVSLLFVAFFVFISQNVWANNNASSNEQSLNYNYNYGNSFIFVENGVEFSVFPDGQFDFNIIRNNSRFNISYNSPQVSVSFNSGHNYDAYVQYDEFGAVIQVENIPIFYDGYGRIAQAGNVNIYYNNFGYVSRVGGLYVHYNGANRFSHCTGYINIYNRRYVYRPWHNAYRIPYYKHCVVYNRPYRVNYYPVRYTYRRPFYNNYRPVTSVGRRSNVIQRNRSYATANRSRKNITQVNRVSSSRPVTYKNNGRRDQYHKPSKNHRNEYASLNNRKSPHTSPNRQSSAKKHYDTPSRKPSMSSHKNTTTRLGTPSRQGVNTKSRTYSPKQNGNQRSYQKPNPKNTRIYSNSTTRTSSSNRKTIKPRTTTSRQPSKNVASRSSSNHTKSSTRRRS